MSFQNVGFLDTSTFTAMYVVKYRERAENGILRLRDVKDGEADPSDLPILKEWKGARAILQRLRAGAAQHFGGVTPELGRAWVETVPPLSGTPWERESADYADQYVRTRTCLIPSPGALSYCGMASMNLLVGVVTAIDMHLLCSEANFGEHARVHLVADVKVPDVDPGA